MEGGWLVALLRQPGGFERVVTIHVLLHLRETAVLKPDRHEHRDCRLDAASLCSDCAVDDSIDEVALAFPEFSDRGPIAIGNLEDVIPRRKHLLDAPKCAEAASFPDDPRVKKAQRFLALGSEVIRPIGLSDRARVSVLPIRGHRAFGRVKEPTHDLDVLLRHRPRIISLSGGWVSVAACARKDRAVGLSSSRLPQISEGGADAGDQRADRVRWVARMLPGRTRRPGATLRRASRDGEAMEFRSPTQFGRSDACLQVGQVGIHRSSPHVLRPARSGSRTYYAEPARGDG